MGRRKDQQKQEPLWIAHTELAAAPGHPFYEKLNELLDAERFEVLVEGLCARFYADKFGRPESVQSCGQVMLTWPDGFCQRQAGSPCANDGMRLPKTH